MYRLDVDISPSQRITDLHPLYYVLFNTPRFFCFYSIMDKKMRKVEFENGQYPPEWTESYFFVLAGPLRSLASLFDLPPNGS
jgi:hypothetical protein